jgi:hypothetical protein
MATSSISDVWFYVNPENEQIDAVLCYFPLGMSIRQGKDWEITTKEDSGIYDVLTDHNVYQLDWDSDTKVIDDSFDFDNYDDVTHIALKMYDNGELNLAELKKYAELIYTASTAEDMPQAEDAKE